jgi:hypothetical protein
MSEPFAPHGRGERAVVAGLLELLGMRELVTAQTLGSAVRYAETLSAKQVLAEHAAQELMHFEVISAAYESLGVGDLFARVGKRAAHVIAPNSWPEAVVAQLLHDRPGRHVLRRTEERLSAWLPKAHALLLDEEGHDGVALAMLRECCEDRARARAAQAHVLGWLRVTLRPFCEAAPHGVGRTWQEDETLADVVREYVQELRPVLGRVGLTLPARVELQLELPPGVLE